MYVKAVTKRNPAGRAAYSYHRLVQAYRSSRGPRQQTILNLGTLELPKHRWKALADRIEQILQGQPRLEAAEPEIERLAQRYAPLVKEKLGQRESEEGASEAEQPLYRSVDLKSVQSKKARTVGPEYVGWEYFRRLKMPQALAEVGFGEQQIQVAAVLIVGRLVHPASERATLEWAQKCSGLAELMGAPVKSWSHNLLYRVSDKLFEHKGKIEGLLQGVQKGLFDLQERVILYDLTNTYFEGEHYDSSDIAYARSKDKRNDCPLITVGLVIDEWGFAKRSEFFAGNVVEPESLKQMLEALGAAAGSTVVIDAGIASEDNLKLLKQRGFQYVCVARSNPPGVAEGQPDEALVTIKAQEDNRIEAKLQKGAEEWVLMCESSKRRAKEQGMKSRFQKRFEEGLEGIRSSLQKKGGTKRYEKVLERIGRLKERSHGIHQYYDIEVEQREGIATEVRYRYSRAEQAEQRYSGRYYIRTTRTDLSEKEIWQLYVTLSGIEDSFRSLKSELGLRPVYHYVDRRIKAHLFITMLAYHLLNAIRFRLRAHGYAMRWSTMRSRLSTHVLVTTSMKSEDGKTVYIRRATEPELVHREIYRALGLRLSPMRARRYEV